MLFLCPQVQQFLAAANMDLVLEIYILVVFHAVEMRTELHTAAITLMKLQVINMMYECNVDKVCMQIHS